MRYNDYLLKVLKDECPFCDIKKEYVLEKGKHFTVLLARAPYAKDHVLIVPRRHIVHISEITSEEWGTLVPIIKKWIKKLEKIHKEVNLLLRDGEVNGIIGKSISHLHFHLVPDCLIYAPTGGLTRKVYSDYQLAENTLELKNKVKTK